MSPHSVKSYYDALESRIGYRIVLGDTRHFGYYKKGTWWPFPINSALRAMEELLFQSLRLTAGAKVLDAGCGVGHVAMFMGAKGLNVEAIDLLARHAEKAKRNVQRRHLEDRVQVSRQSYQDLSFGDGTFDGVYTMETLSHATNAQQALREFYRVLKPGGAIVSIEYEHKLYEKGPALDALTRVNDYSSMTAFQNFTAGTIPRLLRETGFEDVTSDNITDNVFPMLRFFAILAFIPYLIIKLFRLERTFPNAMSAVELYRYADRLTYNVIRAQKPR